MIKTAIDTDKIGKYIGNELYRISTLRNVTQTEIAKKLGVKPNGIGVYMTGKVTTKNLDQYWRIAEAIPISRPEFDQIVEDAKRHVLGDFGAHKVNEDPEIAYATLARHNGVSPDDVKKALELLVDISGTWKNANLIQRAHIVRMICCELFYDHEKALHLEERELFREVRNMHDLIWLSSPRETRTAYVIMNYIGFFNILFRDCEKILELYLHSMPS